jgi:cell division protein FtsW
MLLSMTTKAAKSTRFLNSPVNHFYMMIISTAVLVVLGLIMVFSASSIHAIDTKGYAFAVALRQFVFLVVGVPFAILLASRPVEFWSRFAKLGLFFSIVLVTIVMIPGVGKEVNGNRNWIDLKVVDIQPGEFTKFLLILWAAYLLARKESAEKIKFNVIALLAPGFAIVILGILRGRDLGTAAVVAAIFSGLLFVSGVDLRKMGSVAIVLFAGLAIGIVTSDYRRARFLVFLDPFDPNDYKNFGWQPAHSLLGLATGGVFGVGLGGSRQKWGNLPEAHTDFIYSVIGEELGLVGTLGVLILLGTLVYSIFRISLRASDPFSRYVCAGVACWIGIQSILNIGTAISVLPVVGVTLPLVSYGGSALLTTICALGFVAGVSLRDKEVKKELVRRFAKS